MVHKLLIACGFSYCRAQALGAHALVVGVNWLTCPSAHGIFLEQEWNLCPLNWQVDFIHCTTKEVPYYYSYSKSLPSHQNEPIKLKLYFYYKIYFLLTDVSGVARWFYFTCIGVIFSDNHYYYKICIMLLRDKSYT